MSTDNGRDCLTLLNGGNIDLAFIDVHMPELNGTEAFWAARKQGIQTFVTLMSNPPSTEAVEMARKLKAYEFLFKPFKPEDAVAIMHTFNRITSPTKVLIVDDSLTVRQIVQKVVKGSMFNCDIAEAADGDTALALCKLRGIRRGLPRLQHARPERRRDHEAADGDATRAARGDDLQRAQCRHRARTPWNAARAHSCTSRSIPPTSTA